MHAISAFAGDGLVIVGLCRVSYFVSAYDYLSDQICKVFLAASPATFSVNFPVITCLPFVIIKEVSAGLKHSSHSTG